MAEAAGVVVERLLPGVAEDDPRHLLVAPGELEIPVGQEICRVAGVAERATLLDGALHGERRVRSAGSDRRASAGLRDHTLVVAADREDTEQSNTDEVRRHGVRIQASARS